MYFNILYTCKKPVFLDLMVAKPYFFIVMMDLVVLRRGRPARRRRLTRGGAETLAEVPLSLSKGQEEEDPARALSG